MPVRSAPCFWIECDGDGCTARSPDADDDIAALALPEDAHCHAYDNEWEHTDGGLWLCPNCQLDEKDGDGLAEIARISADADLYRKTDGVVIRREEDDR